VVFNKKDKIPMKLNVNKERLSFLLSAGLGIVFLMSGIPKVLNVNSFFFKLNEFGLAKLSYLAPFIASFETLLGVSLIFQVYRRISSISAMIILFAYTIVLFINNLLNNVDDCGCFPLIDILQTNVTFMYIRNIILILFALYIYKTSKSESWITHRYKQVILIILGSLSLTMSGFTMNSPLLFANTDKELLSQKVNNLLQKKLDNNKTYLIFIFSPKCTHCWNVSENIKKYKVSGHVDEIIGLTNSTDTVSIAHYSKALDINFKIEIVDREQLKKITTVIPFAFIMQGQKVINVLDKDIPHPLLNLE
jgi:uncharacterized membrane protein YphA (DoxX/SURF4 family)